MISLTSIFFAACVILTPLSILYFLDKFSCEQQGASQDITDAGAIPAKWELVTDDPESVSLTRLSEHHSINSSSMKSVLAADCLAA